MTDPPLIAFVKYLTSKLALLPHLILRILEMLPDQSGKINFYFLYKSFSLRNRNKLKIFLRDIFQAEHRMLESLSCIFCSDDYLLNLNQQFLGHDYYTDILTFNYSELSTTVMGELYISIERVRENAVFLKSSFASELLRVVFHGVLHLCGYNDSTSEEIDIIRKLENKYLKSFLL